MKTIIKDNMPSDFSLFLWGDHHVGNMAMDEGTIRKFIERVKSTKNSFWASGGDQLESITLTDKRFMSDVHAGKSKFNQQRDCWIELFEPIGDKLLWMLDGNHEYKLKNQYDVIDDICKHFNIENSSYTVKAIFPEFRLLDYHGSRTINSIAAEPRRRRMNRLLSMKRKMAQLPGDDCEVMACHHHHFVGVLPPFHEINMITNPSTKQLEQVYPEPQRIWLDRNKGLYRIPEEERWFCVCGSALRGYIEGVSTYVERFGYKATELGCVEIIVKNDKVHDVKEIIM